MTDTETKLITGDKLIQGLLELGIVDNRTESITIQATVGQAIKLTIVKFGDDRLLKIIDGYLHVTHSETEAIAK